ncbi:aspartic peptidase domain-containing protein, partial [Pavlovales sp. CCMP2436]
MRATPDEGRTRDVAAHHARWTRRLRATLALLAGAGTLVGVAALQSQPDGIAALRRPRSAEQPAQQLAPGGPTPSEIVLDLEPISFHARGQIQTRMRIAGEEFVMMVDSASADVAVVLRDCLSCSKHRQMYVPGARAVTLGCDSGANGGVTCRECFELGSSAQCGYSVTYADSSHIHAFAFEEEVSFGGDTAPVRTHIGAIFLESEGFEPAHVDGIWGLGMRPLASLGQPTALDALVASGAIADRFSLCIREQGGKLVLGGGAAPPTAAHPQPYQWTPLVGQEDGYYSVELESLLVGSVRVPAGRETLAEGGVVLDSGSSAVMFPVHSQEAFRRTWREECLRVAEGRSDRAQCLAIARGGCLDVNERLFAKLPAVSFVFRGGVALSLRPAHYLQPDIFCESEP